MKSRVKWLDVLKVIGLFCIILAHVNPPSWLFQIRNFDVVLLMVLSSYLYFYLSKNKPQEEDSLRYLWKRVKRLVFPTYIFLAIFFLAAMLISPYPFSANQIVESFLLSDGIGYVWIVRIYLIIAVLLPIARRLFVKSKISSGGGCLILFCILIAVQEMCCSLNLFDFGIVGKDYVAYIIPCFAIIIWTWWAMHTNNRKLLLFSVVATLVYIAVTILIVCITGRFESTNSAKYPFRFYYLVYAFAASGWLMLIARNKKIITKIWNGVIGFISVHSFWIYLWHIPFVFLLNWKFSNLFWGIKWTAALGGAILMVSIQAKIVILLSKTKISPEVLKIFCG